MPARPDLPEPRKPTAWERLEAAQSLATPIGALTHVSRILQEIIKPESKENYALSAAHAALQLAEPEDTDAPWLYKEDTAPSLLAAAVLAEVATLMKDIEAFAGKRFISDPVPANAEAGAPTSDHLSDLVLTRWIKPLNDLAEETIGELVSGDDDCSSVVVLSNGDSLGNLAWYCGDSDNETHPVGLLDVNAWGIHDMHGNVWEWVGDWYDAYDGEETDPTGSSTGTHKVLRGGSWNGVSWSVRASYRDSCDPSYTVNYIGFRMVKSIL